MARGINAESVKIEFLKHAKEEQQHCDWIAERIVQLNGEPNFNPEGLAARSHSEYQEGSKLFRECCWPQVLLSDNGPPFASLNRANLSAAA
jgi:rubrerythrin